jgi:hypothetical protein
MIFIRKELFLYSFMLFWFCALYSYTNSNHKETIKKYYFYSDKGKIVNSFQREENIMQDKMLPLYFPIEKRKTAKVVKITKVYNFPFMQLGMIGITLGLITFYFM